MRTTRNLALGLALAGLTSGCGVALHAGRPTTLGRGTLEVSERAVQRCIHGAPGADSPYRQTLPGPVTDPVLVAYLERFPADVRRTAVAAGIEPLLALLLFERERLLGEGRDGSSSIDFLAMRDELSARMYSLGTQLTAMEFEVDCVRGVLHDVLSDYEESQTDRQLALAIASLVVGAAVLVPAPKEILYMHEHNVLRPVVLGEDPDFLYPTFIFRLLTFPGPSGGPSPRADLVELWRELIAEAVSDDDRAVAERVLHGDGGIHDPPLLALHEELLEALGATLDALARDIDLWGMAITIVLEEGVDIGHRETAPPSP